MKLIVTSGSDCLQSGGSYPKESLNNLAVNKVSLADKYHLENMKILATNPIASEFLYTIMTDPNFVKGKNYREEVKALVNAKSKVTARALYYYIVNPNRKYLNDVEFLDDYSYDMDDAHISDRDSVAGSNDPDYLKNLIKINKIDDELVMHFVSLLMNYNFIKSPYKDFDIKLLQSISSKPIFMDLYRLMIDEVSLNNGHHKRDSVIISQTADENVRKLLLEKATDELSLNSTNHDYDMEYILKLDLNFINKTIYNEMNYYLFKQKGINDPQHKEKLEKLLQGILVERSSSVSRYLDALQSQINDSNFPIIEVAPTTSFKIKSRILSLFKKDTRKKDDF